MGPGRRCSTSTRQHLRYILLTLVYFVSCLLVGIRLVAEPLKMFVSLPLFTHIRLTRSFRFPTVSSCIFASVPGSARLDPRKGCPGSGPRNP